MIRLEKAKDLLVERTKIIIKNIQRKQSKKRTKNSYTYSEKDKEREKDGNRKIEESKILIREEMKNKSYI